MTKSINSRTHKLSAKFFDQYLAQPGTNQPTKEQSDSYWQIPQHGGFCMVTVDSKDFRSELQRMWAGDSQLLCLIEPLYRLSQSVEEPSDASAEISPFIYAMF